MSQKISKQFTPERDAQPRQFRPQPVKRDDAGGVLWAPVDQHGVESGDTPSYGRAAIRERCADLNTRELSQRTVAEFMKRTRGVSAPALCRAMNRLVTHIIWTGCSKADLAQAWVRRTRPEMAKVELLALRQLARELDAQVKERSLQIRAVRTAAERKRTERNAKRDAGLAPVEVWAPTADHPQIQAFAERLRTEHAERQRAQQAEVLEGARLLHAMKKALS